MTKSSSANTTITSQLIKEIREALESVKFGSIEIFIQNKVVTQITVRNIHKTSMDIEKETILSGNKDLNIPKNTQIHAQKSSVKV